MTSRMAAVVCAGVLALGFGATTLRAQAPGGPHEGITVHGDWTIVVRNGDGSVASRHTFQNSLVAPGASFLSRVLARKATVGEWSIVLFAAAGVGDGGVCPAFGGGAGGCAIFERGAYLTGQVNTLTLDVPAAGPDAGKFVLTGSVKGTFSGAISIVDTRYVVCNPALSATTSCVYGGLETDTFTSHLLPALIPVAAKQTIDVTVVISFS